MSGRSAVRTARSCAFVIATTCSAHASSSSSPSIDEALESPDGDRCLTRASLVGGISRWLQRDEVGGMLRVRVRGSSSSEVRFEILREGRTVERVFDARGMSCEHLRGVVTFSIAVAIESALRELRAETRPDATAVGATPEPPSTVASPKPPGRASSRERRAPKPKRKETVRVSMAEVVLLGNPPGTSLGLELGLARPFEGGWELAAGALQTTGSAPFTLGDETVKTWLTLGWAHGCRDLPFPSKALRLALCAGGAAGSMSVRGYDLTTGRSTSLFWGAIYLRGEAVVPIASRISLRFAVAPEFVIARPSLVVVEPGTDRARHRLMTQATALALSGGLSLSF